jgi:hypothetical protein
LTIENIKHPKKLKEKLIEEHKEQSLNVIDPNKEEIDKRILIL